METDVTQNLSRNGVFLHQNRLHCIFEESMLRKVGPILCAALLLAGCFISDQHRSVTKEMGWQCTGVTDTKDERFRHVESIKMWFLENPHYEERASGPRLCADLEQSRKPTAAATFDVWGNAMQGMHGYDLTSIAIGSRKLEIYEGGGGGLHDDRPHYGNFNSEADRKEHPEFYHFPLEVFKQ